MSLVFDDTLLFDIDKFSGYDRIETGTRANYGFGYTAQFVSGAYLRAVAGQSYQIAGQNEFDTEFYQTSGLATDASDYVTGVYFQATRNISFSAQQRFDQDDLTVQRTDLGSWVRYGPLQARVNYADVPGNLPTAAPAGIVTETDSEEILAAGALAITEDWSLLAQSALRHPGRSDDHRRSWPALSGRLLQARRDLSAVLHPRSGHRAG